MANLDAPYLNGLISTPAFTTNWGGWPGCQCEISLAGNKSRLLAVHRFQKVTAQWPHGQRCGDAAEQNTGRHCALAGDPPPAATSLSLSVVGEDNETRFN